MMEGMDVNYCASKRVLWGPAGDTVAGHASITLRKHSESNIPINTERDREKWRCKRVAVSPARGVALTRRVRFPRAEE